MHHPFRNTDSNIILLLSIFLFVVIIIISIYMIIKNKQKTDQSYDESIRILDQRFASGEISEEKYRSMKKTIRSKEEQ